MTGTRRDYCFGFTFPLDRGSKIPLQAKEAGADLRVSKDGVRSAWDQSDLHGNRWAHESRWWAAYTIFRNSVQEADIALDGK
jgi:hypothetical protein